jgi:hypothetical protein
MPFWICDDDRVTTAAPVEFRARVGRGLTVVIAVLGVAAVVSTAVDDPEVALRYGPAMLVPAAVAWLLFARPAVIVSDAGVELRNVLRTIELPWPSIERVDTKYALTLHSAYGVYAAWAAPAPGRAQTLRSGPQDLAHLPPSSYIGGGVRPGDLVTSASGQAAAYIRQRWQELHDAGHLDDPRLEHARPVVRWHVLPAVAVLALVATAVVAARSL